MLIPLTDAGEQRCFPVKGKMLCNYTVRKTKNGLMAMFPNVATYLAFPITRKWKKNKKEPDLEALKKIVKIINQQNEKTPVSKTKGSDHLM